MRLAWAFLFALCGSCALAAGTLDPADGTVFYGKHAFELLGMCSRDTPQGVQGAWDPMPEQITALERALPQALADHIATHPRTRQALNNLVTAYADHDFVGYDRQYSGLLIGGRRLIYVNAFPHEERDFDGSDMMDMWRQGPDWRHHAMTVCDGGQKWFGVLYDPQTGRFEDFQFSGHF